jgi:hydrogenase maturation protease
LRTLVLGIGNDILGDDGIGIQVAREVNRRINEDDVEVKETSAAGLNLLELVRGYQKLFIADAILTENTEAGKIHRFPLDKLAVISSFLTPHGASLRAMLEIGNTLFPGEMPEEVIIYAVQIFDSEIVTDRISETGKVSLLEVTRLIIKEIEEN